jgi:hypothetical protein
MEVEAVGKGSLGFSHEARCDPEEGRYENEI